MLLRNLILPAILSLSATVTAHANSNISSAEDITVTRDVTYGEGIIEQTSGGKLRKLLMDVYTPTSQPVNTAGHPAVLFAFGGSFHRGTKGESHFQEDGAQDSSMADYCRTFASKGYVCFSIEYRLTQEDPTLNTPINPASLMPEKFAITPATTQRVDFARNQMGLPALDAAGRNQFWRAILSASEDMGSAIDHVQEHASAYKIDPDKLAIGGFSAGAITAINTAYGASAPVKAVISLSGTSWGYNLGVTANADQPPLLMLVGQNDLPAIQNGSAHIASLFSRKGITYETGWVAGFGHFYPMGAVTLSPNLSKSPVSERVLDFLDSTLKSTE